MTIYLAELFPLVQINTLRGQLLITYTSEKISSKDAWTHSHTVPSISCHLTATSPSFMLRHWAIYSNSTSNAHLSMCRLVNSLCAALRLISLKPHCVSLTPRTHRNQTKKWNPFIKIVLKNDLYNKKNIPLVNIIMCQRESCASGKCTRWASHSFRNVLCAASVLIFVVCMLLPMSLFHDCENKLSHFAYGKEKVKANLIQKTTFRNLPVLFYQLNDENNKNGDA